ncbi:MAG: acyltransferase [Cyanobacteria bacterium P01_F01_bin.53]
MIAKHNAFDLLRLILAISVVVTHGYLIGGYGENDPLALFSSGQTNLGEIGVMGFFALSGYLITASFERSKNLVIFTSHRCLRLLPGFWACLIITGLVLAPLIFITEGRSLSDFPFLGSRGAIKYIIRNAFVHIRQWNIGNVLDAAAYRDSLNGSLWSLFPEVQCYFFTIVVGYLGLLKKCRILLIVIAAYLCILFAINANVSTQYGPAFLANGDQLKLYAPYTVGMCLYLFKNLVDLNKVTLFILFSTIILLLKVGGYTLVAPLVLPLFLIAAFSKFKVRLNVDLSYGIYIYSFPLQQLIHHYFKAGISVGWFLILSIVISSCFGWLSFQIVEKPFMKVRRWLDANYFAPKLLDTSLDKS